jgi:hypothetical protein
MALRDAWVEKRLAEAAESNGAGRNLSQMHFARNGIITEEMEFVARREKLATELVRSEIARGRAKSTRTSAIPPSPRTSPRSSPSSTMPSTSARTP